MLSIKIASSKLHMPVLVSLLISGLFILGAASGFSQNREKAETIEASSWAPALKWGRCLGSP